VKIHRIDKFMIEIDWDDGDSLHTELMNLVDEHGIDRPAQLEELFQLLCQYI